MTKETILVVEDETLVGLELKEDLERLGYSVPDVVESGEAVVQAVARYQPDLLLMDVRLSGGLDGIEAAYQAKAEFDLPVIFLTAYSDAETLRRAAIAGPDAYLLKPFDERELAANVKLALSRAKSGEAIRHELRGAMALIDALEEPGLIADTQGRVTHANRAATTLLKLEEPGRVAKLELSDIVEGGWGGPVRKLVRVLGAKRDSPAQVASVEPLFRSDGRLYGYAAIFGAMERRERLLLESTATDANSALIRLLPGPEAAGPGFSVGGFLDPCLSGSGDFFDAFTVGPNQASFYGLDVMGHGIIASLLAFSLHDLIPILAWGPDGAIPTPTAVLRSLYERYYRKDGPSMNATFFTIAFGSVDRRTGEYRVARAGHVPVLHLEAGGRLRVHYTKGAAVGVMDDAEIEEASGILAVGDRLLALSDGLLDAFGKAEDGLARGGAYRSGLEASLEAVSAFCDGLRGRSLEDFVAAFEERSRKARAEGRVSDDASLLVLERLPS
jgi:Serine phosphatase RsbU, regulator of sigma subunit